MKKVIVLSILFLAVQLSAQTKLRKADKFFATYAYVDAAAAYEEYLATVEKPSVQTLKNAAESYYHNNDSRNALKYYEQVYQLQGQNMTDLDFLRYIQSMKGVTDYERAEKLTKEFLMRKGDQKEIDRYMRQKSYMDSLSKTKALHELRNLDINTDKSDFGPSFYGQKIVYASAKDTAGFKTLYSWNKQPFLKLYVAERNAADNSLYSDSVFVADAQSDYHDALATFSADLKTVYFTTNILKKDKLVLDKARTNNFQIIKGTIEGGKLTKRESMFFNSKDYSVGHPALSEDGRWLFFASDMPGGVGGTDLYVVPIAEDGTMGTPQNLGPTINTIGEETFPFFRDGILYFASDGHYGYGGLDVYQSSFSGAGQFSEPKNLGTPVNGSQDDFGYIVDAAGTYGYMSSNRAQGKGDDDLYSFLKSKPECWEYISGKVVNKKSQLPIIAATVKAYNPVGDVIAETRTDPDGLYKLKVPCGTKVKVEASKPEHSSDDKTVETGNKNGNETKDINFELSRLEDLIVKDKDREKIIVNPIFFDYDKWDITPQAEIELDKVVYVMQKFPNVRIKIESHTDSRGKDAYNMTLSDNRAKSTQTYIIAQGIDPSRIESAVGYGESRLVNKCRNGVKCSEEEHLKNRRSDFVIINK